MTPISSSTIASCWALDREQHNAPRRLRRGGMRSGFSAASVAAIQRASVSPEGGAGARESTSGVVRNGAPASARRGDFWSTRTACGRIAAVRRCTPTPSLGSWSLTHDPATGVVVLVYHGRSLVSDRRSTTSPASLPTSKAEAPLLFRVGRRRYRSRPPNGGGWD